MTNTRIYLDHAATTPMPAEVIEVMTHTMQEIYGNASTSYAAGREARHILDHARQTLAATIGAGYGEIYLTSGGTESDNWALIGAMEEDERVHGRKGTLITTAIEHHAILHTCNYLEARGYHVVILPVDEIGMVHSEDLGTALNENPDTALVSVMMANNEIGTIEPIATCCKYAHDHGALFHTDAVQAYGKIPVDVKEIPVDLLSVSAHKIGGPRGIGFLYIRSGVQIASLLHGGSQERGRRAGTENVAGAAGFARAAELAFQNQWTETERDRMLQTAFYGQLVEALGAPITSVDAEQTAQADMTVSEVGQMLADEHVLPERACIPWIWNGPAIGADRLTNNVSISLPGQDLDTLLINLDLADIAASGGSACTTGALDPSHVIMAISGGDAVRARGTLRFTFGPGNTREQMAMVTATLVETIARMRDNL